MKTKRKILMLICKNERLPEKKRLFLLFFGIVCVLFLGLNIGTKSVQAAEIEHMDIGNSKIIRENEICLATRQVSVVSTTGSKTGTDYSGTLNSDSTQQDLLADLPLSDIQDVLQQNADTENISFLELVKSLMQADSNTDKQTLFRQILRSAFGDVEEGRQVFVQILLLTAACAF